MERIPAAADYIFIRFQMTYCDTRISRTALRTFKIIDGATESSSSPIFINSSVSSRSAPSSPQMPAHFPYLCTASQLDFILTAIKVP